MPAGMRREPPCAALLAILLTGLAVIPVSAQERSPTLTVTPLGGSAFFPSEIIGAFTLDPVDEPVTTSLENHFAPTVRTGVNLSNHVSAELGLLYAPTEVSFDPTVFAVEADLLILGAGGRYRFLPSATVSPFLAAGAGLKHLDVALFEAETDFMWNVGAGVLFDTGWVADVRVEVRDYMSEFRDRGAGESLLQHDVWAGLGLEFGIL